MLDIDFHLCGITNSFFEKNYPTKKKQDNLFLHSWIPHSMTFSFLKQMDVLLFPQKNKVLIDGKKDIADWSSPLKLFEYMSSKTPIIGLKTNTTTDLMKHKEDFFFLNHDSKNYWVKAIYLLKKDKKLSKRIAKNAFLKLEKNYTWDIRAKKIFKEFS